MGFVQLFKAIQPKIRTANCSFVRRARASVCAKRSENKSLLGRYVNGSNEVPSLRTVRPVNLGKIECGREEALFAVPLNKRRHGTPVPDANRRWGACRSRISKTPTSAASMQNIKHPRTWYAQNRTQQARRRTNRRGVQPAGFTETMASAGSMTTIANPAFSKSADRGSVTRYWE